MLYWVYQQTICIYRVIHDLWTLLQEVISLVFVIKKVNIKFFRFGRLRNYGHFLIPVHALVWTASHGTSWRLMYSAWWLMFCVASIIFALWLAQFTTERQPVLRSAVAFSKTSFKHRSIQIKGNFTKRTLHLYFKCIMYYAGLLFYSVYCQ